MTANGWFQIGLYVLVLFLITKPVGIFLTRVFEREKTILDPLLRPVERLIYRVCGVDENKEMRWTEYGTTMLVFSGVSLILLYLFERLQLWLPWNPQKLGNVAPDLAWNTAVSFTTNTNWQAYTPEVTMSYSHADGRIGLSQLCVGRCRHCVGDCGDSRSLAARIKNHRQLLGGFDALFSVDFVAGLPCRFDGADFAGRDPEFEALCDSTTRRTANCADTGAGRENDFAKRNAASDRAWSYGITRSHQNVRYKWRWLFLRE